MFHKTGRAIIVPRHRRLSLGTYITASLQISYDLSTTARFGLTYGEGEDSESGYLQTSAEMNVNIVAVLMTSACILAAHSKLIDVQESGMTVRVYKAGVLSALGHDHEISAPIAGGTVDISSKRVELRTRAAELRVRDPGVSDKDREQIQKTMLGPEVLDVDRYPQIVFQSAAARQTGAGSWTVTGKLTLHGQTRLITVEVQERDRHYTGTARLKQSEFGIKPIKVAGGAVKVKDEVRIEFDVTLTQEQSAHGPAGK